ncbi:hypothetical protein SDC9_110264 [bioreactor metagenome]|uniref:Uncharacterized protein n=1 Tax=bioreactor metagenome TaxID=1076179 RepID=A0A645BNL6_9ZZZZ
MAFKADVNAFLRRGHLPYVAVDQPIVGQLYLLAVGQLLAEQAVFVADGAAHRGQIQCRQAVQKAGSQAAQTAVAQTRLGL